MSGIAALALGMVYGLGVANVAAELHGAHLSVPQTLPLVPVSALLTRGMAEAIWVALLLAVLAAGAVAVAWVIGIQPVQRTFVPRLRVSRTQRGQLNPVTTILLVIGVILIVYSVWLSDPVSALRTGTLFVAAAFLGYYMRFNRTRPAIIAFAVLVFGGFGLNLIHAVVYPDRLPLARAVLRDGQTIRGGFIAKDGSTWYLAVKDHKVLALDADQIARLTLSSRKRADPRKTGELVRSWLR